MPPKQLRLNQRRFANTKCSRIVLADLVRLCGILPSPSLLPAPFASSLLGRLPPSSRPSSLVAAGAPHDATAWSESRTIEREQRTVRAVCCDTHARPWRAGSSLRCSKSPPPLLAPWLPDENERATSESGCETRAGSARWGEARRAVLDEGGRESPPERLGLQEDRCSRCDRLFSRAGGRASPLRRRAAPDADRAASATRARPRR